jgi:hypothetical protein
MVMVFLKAYSNKKINFENKIKLILKAYSSQEIEK